MPNPRVSIIIPIAPYHTELAQRALDSAQLQTVNCTVLYAVDEQQRGPAFIRNQLLKQVKTPFVVFLDADDWLNTRFVEKCLWAHESGKYVYTDWLQETDVKVAPEGCWCEDRKWHVITTLLETDHVRQVNGFDEDLPGGEDTDFYWKLTRAGVCGIHLDEPLFHYGKEGKRARAFVHGGEYDLTMRTIAQRYGGIMGCCGGNGEVITVNEPQAGFILVTTLWEGNRDFVGSITGNQYPRAGNGKQVYIDPRDATAQPHLFRVVDKAPAIRKMPLPVQPPEPTQPPAQGVRELAARHFNKPVALDPSELAAIPVAEVKPDVRRILDLAQEKPIEDVAIDDSPIIDSQTGETIAKPKRGRPRKNS